MEAAFYRPEVVSLIFVVRQVFALLQKYHLNKPPGSYLLYKMAKREGIIVKRYPFQGRILARYVQTGDDIALLTLKRGLPRTEFKHMLACGLGQRCLKIANGVYVHGLPGETEVEDFAALLLLPPGTIPGEREKEEYACCAMDDLNVQKIANSFQVPAELVRRRLEIEKRLNEQRFPGVSSI